MFSKVNLAELKNSFLKLFKPPIKPIRCQKSIGFRVSRSFKPRCIEITLDGFGETLRNLFMPFSESCLMTLCDYLEL